MARGLQRTGPDNGTGDLNMNTLIYLATLTTLTLNACAFAFGG